MDVTTELGERTTFRYENLEQARLHFERPFADAGYEPRHDAYDANEVAGRTHRNIVVE